MNEEKKAEKIQEMTDWVELRDSWTRKRFDYQERWHGWQSPVGLGLGTLLFSLSALVISITWSNLAR